MDLPVPSRAGAEGFCDMAAWGEMKEGWLRHGPGASPAMTPSSGSSGDCDPGEAHACFLRWIESAVGGQHVAIDGKPLRRRFDGAEGERARQVVTP